MRRELHSHEGGYEPHDHDHPHIDELLPDGGYDHTTDATAATIWAIDNVELTTVGIDIGSATSHLMFSRLHLRRRASGYSSRFVVVDRQVLYRSSVLFTPYISDGTIDAEALRTFIDDAYADSGLRREDVDTGAVILTGVALEKANARRVADIFANEGGRFVCASAGHNMEAMLAAHGSGAVARSRHGEQVLNVDIGGGTTKLGRCVDGEVRTTMALWGGARLLTFGPDGRIERIEPPMARLLGELDITLDLGDEVGAETRRRIAAGLADHIVAGVHGHADPDWLLAGGPSDFTPDVVVFSGGVAEVMLGDSEAPTHDLGRELAAALSARASALAAPITVAAEPIRATVVGASQYSMQLSGNTIHISGEIDLPVHNVPVVAIDASTDDRTPAGAVAAAIERKVFQHDLTEYEEPIAVAIRWSGEPRYATLRQLAEGLAAAHRDSARSKSFLVAVLEADVGASIGSILHDELGVTTGAIIIDGVEVGDLDYLDIGETILPANVVPVVIKSLILPTVPIEQPPLSE